MTYAFHQLTFVSLFVFMNPPTFYLAWSTTMIALVVIYWKLGVYTK